MQTEENVPADEADDGAVGEATVCRAWTSFFIGELQNMVLVWELIAHLTTTDHITAFLNAHSYNTYSWRSFRKL